MPLGAALSSDDRVAHGLILLGWVLQRVDPSGDLLGYHWESVFLQDLHLRLPWSQGDHSQFFVYPLDTFIF